MEEKCENCKYYHEFKKFEDFQWKYDTCCIALTRDPREGNDFDAFVLAVQPGERCEMFDEREI